MQHLAGALRNRTANPTRQPDDALGLAQQIPTAGWLGIFAAAAEACTSRILFSLNSGHDPILRGSAIVDFANECGWLRHRIQFAQLKRRTFITLLRSAGAWPYDQRPSSSSDHIFRQLLDRDNSRAIHRVQPGSEESG